MAGLLVPVTLQLLLELDPRVDLREHVLRDLADRIVPWELLEFAGDLEAAAMLGSRDEAQKAAQQDLGTVRAGPGVPPGTTSCGLCCVQSSSIVEGAAFHTSSANVPPCSIVWASSPCSCSIARRAVARFTPSWW